MSVTFPHSSLCWQSSSPPRGKPRGASSSTAVGNCSSDKGTLSSQAPQTGSFVLFSVPYAGNRPHHQPASWLEHRPPRIVVTTLSRQAAQGASSSNAIVLTTAGCPHPAEHRPPSNRRHHPGLEPWGHPPPLPAHRCDGPSGSCPRQ